MPLAEWLFEEGIGENRAILVEDGEIIEAAIELTGELRSGSVVEARLASIMIPGRRGIAEAAEGALLVEPLPQPLTQGRKLRVEITREALREAGNSKYAKGRVTDSEPRPGPSLAERIGAFRRPPALGADPFEEAGWSELIEQAVGGEIAFPGGMLRMSLTPAMILFDVDGLLPPAELAVAGAAAAAGAIRRFGIGGSIGIDLPTVPSRSERQRAAEALDAVLPQPFERTSVNGFGFLQVIRRRERASIPERLQLDPVAASARALLRRAERCPGAGARLLIAAAPVVDLLRSRPHWLRELERRTGRPVRLQADPALTTWATHVQTV